MTDVAARRLHAQRLTGQPCASPVEAVHWLGAVQAQDFPAAKWALGQRTRRTTDADIDDLYDEGAILRTHVMRPTWHFVLPEDIRWLLDLTSPRLRDRSAGRRRQLEIDDGLIARANAALEQALTGGRHLTRPELDDVLGSAGISAVGQRLPHLLMNAELEGIIVSGARHGKQHTYALLEERVPGAGAMDRASALAELTRRYFRSHGRPRSRTSPGGPASPRPMRGRGSSSLVRPSSAKSSIARTIGSIQRLVRLAERVAGRALSRTCCPTSTSTPWATETGRQRFIPTGRSTPRSSRSGASSRTSS